METLQTLKRKDNKILWIKFVDSKFVKTCDALVIGRDINAPFLQLVGFDKVGLAQSNYSKLKTISVRNMGVYGSGDNLESYQGILLKGIDDKTITRKENCLELHVFIKKKYSKWKLYMANIVFKKCFLFQIKLNK